MRYTYFRLAGLTVLLTLLPAVALGYVGWWWVLIFVGFYGSVLFTGAMVPQLGFYVSPIRKGLRSGLSITFDDGPHRDVTPKVLDVLQQEGVKATFFCKGFLVDENPDLALRIVTEGHIIANHTYSHQYSWGWHLYDAAKGEIMDGQRAILRATGRLSKWFRPPFGITNPHIAKAIKALGVNVIAWDLRSLDTLAATPDKVIWRLKPFLGTSTILLLHDHLPHTPEVLRQVIAICRQNGTPIVPLDEMTGLQPYA